MGMRTQGAMTSKFGLGRDFSTMHLPPSFMILRLLVLNYHVDKQTHTHPQTNKQTMLKTSNALCYATTLDKNYKGHALQQHKNPLQQILHNEIRNSHVLWYQCRCRQDWRGSTTARRVHEGWSEQVTADHIRCFLVSWGSSCASHLRWLASYSEASWTVRMHDSHAYQILTQTITKTSMYMYHW